MKQVAVMERRAITVQGIVQGVGFRPFVHALARENGLAGSVRNDAEGVTIEVEGPAAALDRFLGQVRDEAPALALVESVVWHPCPPRGEYEFHIEVSSAGPRRRALISPDVATCADCLRELFDPADRRFHYPFINCTNCGPRFTITRAVPYDRAMTTMAAFPMCPACQGEYDDPANRRFHAQPNACPVCGPRIKLRDRAGREVPAAGEDVIGRVVDVLRDQAIVAIKGLGGYHLACDPFNPLAVRALRARKARQDKPFALMARDLEQVRRLCRVGSEEEALLTAPARPIVLLDRRTDDRIDEAVAPRQTTLGVMLAYTPLHHLLLQAAGMPLVMTSGNRSDEPIAYRDEEVLNQHGLIADYFLTHDRPIHMRCDDSVVMTVPGSASAVNPGSASILLAPGSAATGASKMLALPGDLGQPKPCETHALGDGSVASTPGQPTTTMAIIRRSRGYAPAPLTVAEQFSRPTLACGGELKNTFCLGRERHVFLSQHIGDLENYETFRSFREGITHYRGLFDVRPELVAYDLHPEYLSTKYAQELAEEGLPAIGIQHHHAHIASCLVDNDRPRTERVIGVALDGTGYGTDGAIWGGEFLEGCLEDGFTRLGHLDYVPLPGGQAAIKEPWRLAMARLITIHGEQAAAKLPLAVVRRTSPRDLRLIAQMAAQRINAPLTSSAGRLFDTVAALLDLPGSRRVTYEGQAAVELELAASAGGSGQGRDYPISLRQEDEGWIVETGDIITGVTEDLLRGHSVNRIAADFHRTIASIVVAGCLRVREERGPRAIALSGGTFQNRLLSRQVIESLTSLGFVVYRHHRVPANDGGLALGQAVLADNVFRQGR
ncbi:MAG TPA: carbamoyltransferase HypF [Chloroflexota bacterium]|nr:carbamoyltransferase HypF [Chloroflexota bacterium]